MKYLKLFENHLNEVITEEEVAKICNEYEIGNWILNSNGTVDVDGNVWLSRSQIAKLPLKFGRVDGYFWCYGNQLTSLEGVPQYVGRSFWCNNNNIRSFEGIGYIGGSFNCIFNPIECLWNLFRDTSKIDMFNEWGVIQDDKVILYRLNDFRKEIGKNVVTEKQLNEIKKFYTVL